jgi:serine/threonine protein kinase
MVHDRSGMTTAVGTPLLMAPELVYSDTARESTSAADATAVDVYSFGILLWMMSTQKLNPYEDMDNPWALLAQVARGRRPPLECAIDARAKEAARAGKAAAEAEAHRPVSADAAAGSGAVVPAHPDPPPGSPTGPSPPSGGGSSGGSAAKARRSRSSEGLWAPSDGEVLRGTNLLKLPQSFRDLIARCWHPDPSRRPPFSAVADELSELQELFLLGGCFDPRSSSE